MNFDNFEQMPTDQSAPPVNTPLVSEALMLIGMGPGASPLDRLVTTQLMDQQRQIENLIGRNGLGNGNYRTRDAASARLRNLGPLAQEQLILNADNDDLEIARRSHSLLEPLFANATDVEITNLMEQITSRSVRNLLRGEIIANRFVIPDLRDIHRTFRNMYANRDDSFSPENVRLIEDTYQRMVGEIDRMTENAPDRIAMMEQFFQNEEQNFPENHFQLQHAHTAIGQWRAVSNGHFRGALRYEHAQTMSLMGNIPRRNALMIEALNVNPQISNNWDFTTDIVRFGLDRDPLFLAVFRQCGGTDARLQEVRDQLSRPVTGN